MPPGAVAGQAAERHAVRQRKASSLLDLPADQIGRREKQVINKHAKYSGKPLIGGLFIY